MHLPRPLGTLAFLAAWLTPWRPAYRVRAGRSNLAFFLHHRDAIGRHIAKYGTHEPLVTRWLAAYLGAAPPGIVVDVGANIGWHALHAAQHRNVEAVIAFEPDPLNRERLESAVKTQTNVTVQPFALGDCDAVMQLERGLDSLGALEALARTAEDRRLASGSAV